MTINMGSMYETGYKHGYTKAMSELKSELEALKVENTRLKSEVAYTKLAVNQSQKAYEKLRESIYYWAYCTQYGVSKLCPEKSNELKEYYLEHPRSN